MEKCIEGAWIVWNVTVCILIMVVGFMPAIMFLTQYGAK